MNKKETLYSRGYQQSIFNYLQLEAVQIGENEYQLMFNTRNLQTHELIGRIVDHPILTRNQILKRLKLYQAYCKRQNMREVSTQYPVSAELRQNPQKRINRKKMQQLRLG